MKIHRKFQYINYLQLVKIKINRQKQESVDKKKNHDNFKLLIS